MEWNNILILYFSRKKKKLKYKLDFVEEDIQYNEGKLLKKKKNYLYYFVNVIKIENDLLLELSVINNILSKILLFSKKKKIKLVDRSFQTYDFHILYGK